MEEDALEVMVREVERRLEPNALLAQVYTQLEPLLRLPRRVGQIVSELETGRSRSASSRRASRSSSTRCARSRTASARR